MPVSFRITILHFHKEFLEGHFQSSNDFDSQNKSLKQIEDFVAEKFGRDQDLAKSSRFLQLVILYNQSKH